MFRLKEHIHVNAPIERCFLLSTSIEIVQQTLYMKPREGKLSGLIVNGDRILWRGWKFGLPSHHETLITRYERPAFFQDTMGSGMFRAFQHDHQFEAVDGRTLMVDVLRFSMRGGPVGRLIGKYIVIPHVLNTMLKRFHLLKRIAEGNDWERYLIDANEPARVKAVTAALDSIQRV